MCGTPLLDCGVMETDTERSAGGGTADILTAQRPDRTRADGYARRSTLGQASNGHKRKTGRQRSPIMTLVTNPQSGVEQGDEAALQGAAGGGFPRSEHAGLQARGL